MKTVEERWAEFQSQLADLPTDMAQTLRLAFYFGYKEALRDVLESQVALINDQVLKEHRH